MLTVSKGNYVPPEPVATPEEPVAEHPELPLTPEPAPPAKPQRWEVAVEVPLRSEAQSVRILVVEDGTEKVAYNAVHPSGDKFATTVETRGPATIRVYVGDELVEERVGGRSDAAHGAAIALPRDSNDTVRHENGIPYWPAKS